MGRQRDELWAGPGSPGWTVTVRHDEPEVSDRTALTALDDAALVRLSVAGRRDAFDLIVERHQRSIYQLCYRFVRNHEDASDLAQEVFIRAYRGLGRFHGRSSLGTWLYRVAVNACLNRVTAKVPATEPIDPDRFVDLEADAPGAGLEREERARRVRDALQMLPPTQRATLVLRAYHDLSLQEIATVLGSSVGAVKANSFHALANLRKLLGEERR